MTIPAENDPQRVGTIWMLNLDEPVPIITPRLKVAFRRAGSEQAPALSALGGNDNFSEFIHRFQTGRQCYTAWVENQLAAYGWVSFDNEHIGEMDLHIRLLPGEAYIWDCATGPAFRRNYLYSALLAYIVGELHLQGLCRAWIGADFDNIASQRGMAYAGFHHVADLLEVRILALRQFWVEGLPDVPETIVAEARRVFLGKFEKDWLTISLPC